jgi:hypothetical protein
MKSIVRFGAIGCFSRACIATLCLGGAAAAFAVDPGPVTDHRGGGGQHTWYVSADAKAGGDGSEHSPFNSLALVQSASHPGDTIIVVPAPLAVAPLDGGIGLQPGQRLIGGGPPVLHSGSPVLQGGPPTVSAASLSALPRITNSSNKSNSGDAVELADGVEVSNIVVAGSYRGAMYGVDVAGANLHGNDVSGHNTSGVNGFIVLPFYLETYAAGVANFTTLHAGWAAIMIDGHTMRGSADIVGNYVHDGSCGDGIDVRAMDTSEVTVQVQGNLVTRLPQCSLQQTMEGIGMQASGTAVLHANLAANSEANNGSAGANADSLFANLADSGKLVETIENNAYFNGMGGASTNGFEFILSNGNADGHVKIKDSIFVQNPGDMLEEFNRGVGSKMVLELENVVVKNTTISGGIPVYADPAGTAGTPDNTGECLGIASVGANELTVFAMRNSSFTGCDNNGIELTNNHTAADGDGPPHTVLVDIDHSTISGSRYYNLWINNVTPLTKLGVKVQDSNLSGSSTGVAVAFDQQTTASTQNFAIDLGGGSLGSEGRNCLFGAAIYDLETTGYKVTAHNEWWGQAGGPAASKVFANPAQSSEIEDDAPLRSEPGICRGQRL